MSRFVTAAKRVIVLLGICMAIPLIVVIGIYMLLVEPSSALLENYTVPNGAPLALLQISLLATGLFAGLAASLVLGDDIWKSIIGKSHRPALLAMITLVLGSVVAAVIMAMLIILSPL